MIMRNLFLFLILLFSLSMYSGNITNIQKQFTGKGKVFHIKKTYNLNGDTLYIPEKSTLSFEGGSIGNGIVMGPYGNRIYIKGNYKCANSNYYGNFFLKDGTQLT